MNMLTGIASIEALPEESTCRNTDHTGFSAGSTYNVHCQALMPNIPFGKSEQLPYQIEKTLFLNEGETELSFASQLTCQNYIPTKFVGIGPIDYSQNRGTEFMLFCRNGNPSDQHRVFGTEEGLYGYKPRHWKCEDGECCSGCG